MSRGYETYCLADPVFFEAPEVVAKPENDFAAARSPVPAGWRRVTLDDWLVMVADGCEIPAQGWKVHVSACLDNAEQVLGAVWEYCVPRQIQFKFVRSPDLFFLRNVKYAHRGSSGKFAVIYPSDETQLREVLEDLGETLAGQPGPYVLSDLRWGEGPLFVRYGGFAERWCIGDRGELVLAIENPDGELVPDERGPAFKPPDWVTLPDFLEPHLQARNATTVADLPCEIEEALHFSNGGGVYLGTDKRTGRWVVLKEGRPHAGLAMDRADAVVRLRREHEILERLAGLDIVPEAIDIFTLGGHEFLVQEFIEGEQFTQLMVARQPLVLTDPPAEKIAEYTTWALQTYQQVERAVRLAHERGVVIGDLHPSNVLVRPDGSVRLIDLEGGSDVSEGRRQSLADFAFLAPGTIVGTEVDDYALACLRLFMFMPLTALVAIEAAKAAELAQQIGEAFPDVPRDFLDEAARRIMAARPSQAGAPTEEAARAPRPQADPESWPAVRDALVKAIVTSATPQRDDRLFPGDVEQFHSGGLNLAHGAAGVLYAIEKAGGERCPEHEEWLIRRALKPRSGTRPGFLDGLHGIAHALAELGHVDAALEAAAIADADVGGRWDRLGLNLHSGLAGIALNLAHLADATGERELLDRAWNIADVVAARLGDEASVPEISGTSGQFAGLTRGSAGVALMFLRLYDRSGDAALLDLAATALHQDLRRCIPREDDSIEVTEGWRTMPYLADGSVGIGMVVDEFLDRAEDERIAAAVDPIRNAARSHFYIQSNLFYGRAGMILHLSREHAPGTAWRDPDVAGHIERLGWHALTYEGGLAFPGEYLMRLSMDLGTGSAGVLLALAAALAPRPAGFPFLGPRPAAAGRVPEPEPVLITNTPTTQEGR